MTATYEYGTSENTDASVIQLSIFASSTKVLFVWPSIVITYWLLGVQTEL